MGSVGGPSRNMLLYRIDINRARRPPVAQTSKQVAEAFYVFFGYAPISRRH